MLIGEGLRLAKTSVGPMDNSCYLISTGGDALLIDAANDADHLLALADSLGVRITDEWYMQIVEHMDDAALATDHNLAQSLDMEQSLKSAEQFKKSRYRPDKEG